MKKAMLLVVVIIGMIATSMNVNAKSLYIPDCGTYSFWVEEQYDGSVYMMSSFKAANGSYYSKTFSPIILTQAEYFRKTQARIDAKIKSGMHQEAKDCWTQNKYYVAVESAELVKELFDTYKLPAEIAKGDFSGARSFGETLDKYSQGKTKLQECMAASIASYLF